MSLTIDEFEIGELIAKIGRPLYGMKILNFYYGENYQKVPKIRVYGGMKVAKGKFGNYFQLDLKDDQTEKFFKILVLELQTLTEYYLKVEPRYQKSPIIEYGPYYTLSCKIDSKSKLNGMKVGKYFRGFCTIRICYAFSGNTSGITLALDEIIAWD